MPNDAFWQKNGSKSKMVSLTRSPAPAGVGGYIYIYTYTYLHMIYIYVYFGAFGKELGLFMCICTSDDGLIRILRECSPKLWFLNLAQTWLGLLLETWETVGSHGVRWAKPTKTSSGTPACLCPVAISGASYMQGLAWLHSKSSTAP